MDVFAKIAEGRIREALENGEFDDLPNKGKPLTFEDESHIPEDLRMAYRILKNAGCLPPEIELLNEILSLRRMLDTLDEDRERMKKIRELNYKLLKLGELRGSAFNLDDFPGYAEKVVRKLL